MNSLKTSADQLVANGAILMTWSSPAQTHLVGDCDWIGDHQLFWFAAHGDRLEDGQVLTYDQVITIGPDIIEFQRAGTRVARLSSIASADVEDRDDYAIAYSIWRQVEPCVRPLIARSRARFDA